MARFCWTRFFAATYVLFDYFETTNYWLTGYQLNVATFTICVVLAGTFMSGLWFATTDLGIRHPWINAILLPFPSWFSPFALDRYHLDFSILFLVGALCCWYRVLWLGIILNVRKFNI